MYVGTFFLAFEGIAQEILQTSDSIAGVLSAELQRFGLSNSAFQLLTILDSHDDQDMLIEELRIRLAISPAHLAGLLTGLRKRGLLERAIARERRAGLLPAGRKLLQQVKEAQTCRMRELTADFTSLERATLYQLLEKVRRQTHG